MEHINIHLQAEAHCDKSNKGKGGLDPFFFYWILATISPTSDKTY